MHILHSQLRKRFRSFSSYIIYKYFSVQTVLYIKPTVQTTYGFQNYRQTYARTGSCDASETETALQTAGDLENA
jgi:hypothetical protein